MDPSGHESGTLKTKTSRNRTFHPEEQKLLSMSENFLSRNILSKNLRVLNNNYCEDIFKTTFSRCFLQK
jgi:hypothetical protein